MNKLKTFLIVASLILLIGCGEEEKEYTKAELWDDYPRVEDILINYSSIKSPSEIQKKNYEVAMSVAKGKVLTDQRYMELGRKLQEQNKK